MTRHWSWLPVLIGTLLAGCGDEQAEPGQSGATNAPTAAIIEANNRAVGLMGQFNYTDAYETFRTLVDESPDNVPLRINLAIAQLNRQGQENEAAALVVLKTVLEDEPGNLAALYVAGILDFYAGRSEEALDRFRTVAEADPTDAYAAYYTGQCLSQLDRPEEALAWYQRCMEVDPYLRSAYYGAAQAARRVGQADEAMAYLDQFQAMAENPRARLAEIKYTRMGPRAEVQVLGESPPPPARDRKAAWGQSTTLITTDTFRPVERPSLTACDIDLDGRVDVFCTGLQSGTEPPASRVLWNREDGWSMDDSLPLAAVTDVHAALWGDVDGNGWPDVYLCRDGANQLWLQDAGDWSQDTGLAEAEGDPYRSVDGALFDADHDGDLDVFVVNANGPNALLNNNRDGTWRRIGEAEGLPSPDRASREIIVADLDNDRDVDLVVINDAPPHEVYVNDRLWRYQAAEGFEAFTSAPMVAAAAGDIDADGRVELVSLAKNLDVTLWTSQSGWSPKVLEKSLADFQGAAYEGPAIQQPDPQLVLMDVTGTGQLALVRSQWDGVLVSDLDLEQGLTTPGKRFSFDDLRAWAPVLLEPERGYSLVALDAGRSSDSTEGVASDSMTIISHDPGDGRYPFVAVSFTGKHDEGQSMRSNASGIGTRYAARRGARWTMGRVLRDGSGPGQSLQPIPIGLGPSPRLDFLAIEWSDGVYQTELGLSESTVIEETQRQLASCPVLFVRDGDTQRFVSDLLGVGGIGFRTGRDTVVSPRPWERFLMPEGVLIPHDGHYEITVAEPMEESCYLDAARLVQWDLPPGWSMTLDERMAAGGPAPSGEPVFYRQRLQPVSCWDNSEGDVSEALAVVDGVAAEPTPRDHRFLGRLARPHVLELSFDQALDALDGEPVLVLDGWVEYPYSQTCFAAWQAGATYDPPSVEARVGDGPWQMVLEKAGYPAGMPRQMSVPLGLLPTGTTALRISSNLEIYWDAAAVVAGTSCPEAIKTTMHPGVADLIEPGFPVRRNGPQQYPGFDWSQRVPLWDTRHQRGWHSRYGDVTELVAETDSALAIFGPGEAIAFQFESVPGAPAAGWTRRLVFEIDGWCKDQDLFTRDGDTIEPLPVEATGEAGLLHQRYNDRWMGGH
ncbi:MAG: FG-GAP-like repeat-containing protein [Phycisphaerales bacterium]|nr:FG-GAP-like repeat-containing protein [Phycisphaerales bacterium]